MGWRAEEILRWAGAVLPKNVFSMVPAFRISALGSGSCCKWNPEHLAVVKEQSGFHHASFRGRQTARSHCHEHCGESGDIGAAQESLRLWRNGLSTTFVGLDAVRKIEYRTTATRNACNFCKNNACARLSTSAPRSPQNAEFRPDCKVNEGSADARRASG